MWADDNLVGAPRDRRGFEKGGVSPPSSLLRYCQLDPWPTTNPPSPRPTAVLIYRVELS